MEHLDWINDQLTILGEAFGEALTEQRQEIYCSGLAEIDKSRLQVAFRRARYELKWFPKLAELRELAGILPGALVDGRPGPEEAWARMPKGEFMEHNSIVWSEEERTAYAACRSLLLDGDMIGARMAFKERYEKEVAEARSQARPVKWTVSLGYDMEHRLTTLAAAVEEKRLAAENALPFVPEERREEFAHLLPPSARLDQLVGDVKQKASLPGLVGLLARMQMEDVVPEEVKVPTLPRGRTPLDRSAEEVRALRQKAEAQAEFLRRSRNGSNSK